MCDKYSGRVRVYLAIAISLLVLTVVEIGVAAALNASFLLAFASPGAMALAAVTTALMASNLAAAKRDASNYFQCVNRASGQPAAGPPTRCSDQYANFMAKISTLIDVIAAQVGACWAAAAFAWVPWVALAAMSAIVSLLAAQITTLIVLENLWGDLQTCLQRK